jgi:hypothetical protein
LDRYYNINLMGKEADDCDVSPYPLWAICNSIQSILFTITMAWVLCKVGN